MGEVVQCVALMEALQAQEVLTLRGFTAACGSTGSVVVDRWNHVRGVWDFRNGVYYWTDAGYSQPSFRAESLEGAVAQTLRMVAKV